MMLDKDRKMKSVVFLVIGMIFVLSLVVCIYITYSEKDLKETTAEVTNFNVALSGGKKNVSIVYTVDGVSYSSSFYTDDSLTIGDKIKIYYHEKDATVAKLYKTSLIIFICPVIGLVLCIIGLIKVLKKKKDNEKTIEENELAENILSEPNKIVDLEELKTNDTFSSSSLEQEEKEISKGEVLTEENSMELSSELPFKSETISEVEMPSVKGKEVKEKGIASEIENTIKMGQKTDLVNVLPNNYYLAGETLVYEEYSNHKEKIELKDINKIVITINSVGNIVKIALYTEKIKCILTKMKNIDLEKMVNSLKDKMNAMQKEFEETIEHKEY